MEQSVKSSQFGLANMIDVLALCEAWLADQVSDSELFLSYFAGPQSHRPAIAQGGTTHGGGFTCSQTLLLIFTAYLAFQV